MMNHRYLVALFCLWALALHGCTDGQPKPQIVFSPEEVEPPEPAKPRIEVRPPSSKPKTWANEWAPNDWFPSAQERHWTAIVVHHSATDNGDLVIFDRWHRQENNWDGVGYDFVIGNGTDSGDGQVEVTFRWQQQRVGAHCKTPDNWANCSAIGICLVGNFSKTVPSDRQMQSLIGLVRYLQYRYRIPTSRIYGHGTTPGARITDCPGKRFPMQRFKTMLDR